MTRKISNAVAKIALGLEREIALGNLEARRDWGYAPEYVESMWLMLQQDEPDDYVVATGEQHSVKEYVAKSFEVVGLEWQHHVRIDETFQRPMDINFMTGDCARARQKLGWEPKTKFSELVKLMVQADLERWQGWLKGETLPWDAPNFPGETQHPHQKVERLRGCLKAQAMPRGSCQPWSYKAGYG